MLLPSGGMMRRATVPALLICAVFFFSGLVWVLSGPGIQNDEALFASPLYPPIAAESVRLFGHEFPVMIMNYLGTLKSWIYAGIFRIWAPSPVSIRLPALLIAAAAVWIFFLFARRLSGPRAALIALALLATDSMFLLTSALDWGPVALQHLLLMAGLWLLTRFDRPAWLAAGCFAMGLGMWDKAIFVWMLAGVIAGAFAAWPRQILRAATARNLAIAALSFALGASPLIAFNLQNRFATFRDNSALSAGSLDKLTLLRDAIGGRALGSWLVRQDDSGVSREPSNLQGFAVIAAAALLPFARGRATVFVATALLAGWAQMFFGRDVGGSLHHVILLWPFPQLLMGISFAEASRRFGRAGTAAVVSFVAVVCVSNLWVTKEYRARLIRNGGALNWSDAVYPLSDYLRAAPRVPVIATDWGFVDTLRLLNRGELQLRQAMSQLSKSTMTEEDRAAMREMLDRKGSLFLAHTDGNEFYAGARARLEAFAAESGYRKEIAKTIADSNGRPIFEALRFTSAADLRGARGAVPGAVDLPADPPADAAAAAAVRATAGP